MASIPECAICLQSCVHPVCLPCRHVFCFLCMKGASWQSKRCALCRQEVPEDFLERPKLLSPEALRAAAGGGADGGDHAWYYGGSGGWWQYDERTSRELEDASAKGLTSAEMLIAGTLYVADLENMVQYRRNQPARRRRMKRDAAGVPKKGVAGLRLEPEVDAAADPIVGPPLAVAAAVVPSAAAPERISSADGADADSAPGRAQSSSGVGALPSVLPLRPPTILGGHVSRPPSPASSPSLEEALSQLGLSQGPAGEGGGASVDGGLSYECGSGSSEGEGDEPGPAAAAPLRQRGVPLARQLRETRPDRTPPGGGPSGLTRGGRGHTPDGQCTGSQV
ncbi:E3 ubiquitin-protein ligase rnf146-like [Gadus chalcogrammus]|uniref:E3 ubiquitin-protein ligase rnf146-like n=1 Tax=Gadus chalcogrammus TaxID=1042646 RepID=UPI0024C4E0D3|nr:E3 ubiquitin-protein ligase rnf146-like [Gadus chalcogrammus]XP_056437403.1 E3 ubiquitin-protein ligase rnf146-like [Gadus chalcogrammus]XP_056437404.1 E3 ubiquitin-protein ligase rnf146-like [Gadus chalcogrammus]XP_056437405.1 E3 ubiquitin-protein ligase rnf146-like [Gadus chalcogrammus]XP_056437406.1 E3 ubiquitin-protein ligase rnf146-like [Gadus chalcogrammus]XP_056437407.1 E3 ubiquitin-protein ligase rnf146-like [Gadus chalcogrammus]XP_056437408.1 E3 ubiquitin-protein ligase rnf146-lik